MSFLERYKRLDNLLKDALDTQTGVTSYIEHMDNIKYASYSIPNFNDDYKALKKYRHIRNQIVHDNNASEALLTNNNDLAWLNNFYQRVLSSNDPLSLYRKNIKQKASRQTTHSNSKPIETTKKRCSCSLLVALITVLIIGIIVILAFALQ